MMPHAAMWCTIWAIWYLPNRDFAREGFIIMHFAFLAIGLAMPLKYHIPIHACLLLNIIISNTWTHYEYFTLMISLALPLYVGVVIMLFILENSYADQYLIKKQLEISSISDELTGAYNRYKLNELVNEQTERFIIDKDIVILMNSTKASGDTLVRELGRLGVDAYCDTKSFFDRREIKVIMSLISIINNARQDIPLLCVMRSPIGGFTDDELVRIRLFAGRTENFITSVRMYAYS